MFGKSIKFTWLDHWYKFSQSALTEKPDLIILDYQFKNGFRSYLLFDSIADLNIPTFLYTSTDKTEIIKDLKKVDIAWPVNMKYCAKCDFGIFDKVKDFKAKLEQKLNVC
jgi:hypothetical protein